MDITDIKRAAFDWDKFEKVIAIFTRMLDNVVEINGLPLPKQREEITRKRRHGMGIMGLGSALAMLGIKYGSPKAVEFTEMICKTLAIKGFKAGIELAKEKGPAPIFNEEFEAYPLRRFPKVAEYLDHPDNRSNTGCSFSTLSGRQLFPLGKYFEQFPEEIKEDLEMYGCRFTHATSIAPTGCLNPKTLVVTENGLERIGKIGDPLGKQWQQINMKVATDQGNQYSTHYFINGYKDTIKLTTNSGREIEGTPNHQIRVIDSQKGYIWKRLDCIQKEDVIIALGNNYFNNNNPKLKWLTGDISNPNHYHGRSKFKQPRNLNSEICEFIGLLYADGNIKNNRVIRFTNHVDYFNTTAKRISEILKSNFNIDIYSEEQRLDGRQCKELTIHSKALIDFLKLNGLSKDKSINLNIPDLILRSDRSCIYGFIRGYFEGDGNASKEAIEVSGSCKEFLQDIQNLMFSVGIYSNLRLTIDASKEQKNRKGKRNLYKLTIGHIVDKISYMNNIGFITDKGKDLINIWNNTKRNKNQRQILKPIKNVISKLIGSNHSPKIKNKFEDPVYEFITNIENSKCDTYDISVPFNVTYIANGFVSHNTISLTLGNNCSNGIEPSFMHHYKRNIIKEGKKTKEQADVYSYELLKYRELIDPHATPGNLPDYFVTANSVSPKEHIDMQAAAQKWIDSSISKTINIRPDIEYDEFKDLYMYAYEQGCKGVTTFINRGKAVLVDPEQQKNTMYKFELDNCEVIEVFGDEEIEYDGEVHIAANLAEAINEKQFGKF